ncbi:MAG: proton-conducting transporter membrane subunit, partial [Pseudomonadota bacterium]
RHCVLATRLEMPAQQGILSVLAGLEKFEDVVTQPPGMRMPVYATVMMLFTMGNVGLPGTSGFVGEFLTMAGAFQESTWAVFGAAFGVILSAGYALWLYRRVVFGDLIKQSLQSISDMNWREKAIIAPLVFFTILFGIYPAPILDLYAASVGQMLDSVEAAQQAAAATLQLAQK